jgi:hypothetical protein
MVHLHRRSTVEDRAAIGERAKTGALAAVRTRPLIPPRLSSSERTALATAWRAFWISRAIVWAAGMAAGLILGAFPDQVSRLDPYWLTAPFEDGFANLVVAPAARFDASWYLEIAQHGYDFSPRAAFFPLYPALVALGAELSGAPLVAGLVLSCVFSIAGLYLVYRLVALDYGDRAASAATWIMACFPTALTLSALYTEGLFLLLSVGSIYAARRGTWWLAGVAGALAAATRSAGVLLLVPLALLYFYGPRADRPPARAGARWRPRYRPGRELIWLAAIPAGLIGYLAYLGITYGDPLAPFTVQSEWTRIFAPLAGIPLGLFAALRGIFELLPELGLPEGGPEYGAIPELDAIRDLALLAFLALAAFLLVEAGRRRLPAAYRAHVICSLTLPLSVPALDQPLMSLPRFMLVLFPLWIVLALWALERGVMRRILAANLVLLAVASGLFSSWIWAP